MLSHHSDQPGQFCEYTTDPEGKEERWTGCHVLPNLATVLSRKSYGKAVCVPGPGTLDHCTVNGDEKPLENLFC
ncbi:hypothetical protein CEXT_687131 [Caerostris extrusa]|uniref:Uncharacterized protein n=1 Tax=Caerostris extrusa TaxID=172846 RepID=A0AAV4P256_CAEEX|nr:hypothetical protein CEXT_687131 [Caerostris extrusa]